MRGLLGAAALLTGCSSGLDAYNGVSHGELVAEQSQWEVSHTARYAPLRTPGERPERTVYGFWPTWGDPLETLPWDQLTHVGLFDVQLASTGAITHTDWVDARAAEALPLAAPWGTRVHLTVSAFSDSIMNAVLTSPTRRARAVSELVTLVQDAGLHGVNVDFEGLDAARSAQFVLFVQELRAAGIGDIYVCTPAVDWSGAYDFDALAATSDGLFIMGYDFHWSGSNPGPVAPLHGSTAFGNVALDFSLDDHLDGGALATDLVMGLPLYGRGWDTTNTQIPGTRNGSSWSVSYAEMEDLTGQFVTSGTSMVRFPTSRQQVWYDDATTIEAKAEWVLDQGLQGIGFWALTYDDSDPDLWARIDALTHSEAPAPPPDPEPEPGPVEPPPPCQGEVCTDTLPLVHSSTTDNRPAVLNGYACAPTLNEGGGEVVYQITVDEPTFLVATLSGLPSGVDVDVHILSALTPSACLDRGHWEAAAFVPAGTTYVVVDSWVTSGGAVRDGAYTLRVAGTGISDHLAQDLDSEVLDLALTAFDTAWQDGERDTLSYAVADYSLPSGTPRLWLLDLREGVIVRRAHLAHGSGSADPADLALAVAFSNTSGSHMSSVGLLRGAETYQGSRGRTLRFDGLEAGYNSNARSRSLVMFGATYATPTFATTNGMVGLSYGEFAVDPAHSGAIVNALTNGGLLFAFGDDAGWLAGSTYF